MDRILIVEDDQDIAELVSHHLGRAGYHTDVLGVGSEVLSLIHKTHPKLIILDLMLPGFNGLEICRAVRANPKTANIPIIMLTAKVDESDRIVGLELGADDYVTKPFSPKELIARVGAVLRRYQRLANETSELNFGSLLIDIERHAVTLDGQEIKLTSKEFLLLRYFIEHKGRVLSREILLSDVWGYKYTGGTRTVDVHVRHLREKLPIMSQAIVTVKNFGYKLVTPNASST